jgi:TRAP-type C4-dicarboxylate transport system permease small subunit
MKFLIRLNDRLTLVIKVLIIGMMITMLVTLSAQVLMRYAFNVALSWSEELSLALFSWSVLLASALGIREGFHVRLTILLDQVPIRFRSITERLIHLVTMVFGCYLMYGGYNYVSETRGMKSAAIAFPVELLYSAAPVCGLLIVLFAIEHAINGTLPQSGVDVNV